MPSQGCVDKCHELMSAQNQVSACAKADNDWRLDPAKDMFPKPKHAPANNMTVSPCPQMKTQPSKQHGKQHGSFGGENDRHHDI